MSPIIISLVSNGSKLARITIPNITTKIPTYLWPGSGSLNHKADRIAIMTGEV
jgi:hypothetical protein